MSASGQELARRAPRAGAIRDTGRNSAISRQSNAKTNSLCGHDAAFDPGVALREQIVYKQFDVRAPTFRLAFAAAGRIRSYYHAGCNTSARH
jgi:hypothetical protein